MLPAFFIFPTCREQDLVKPIKDLYRKKKFNDKLMKNSYPVKGVVNPQFYAPLFPLTVIMIIFLNA